MTGSRATRLVRGASVAAIVLAMLALPTPTLSLGESRGSAEPSVLTVASGPQLSVDPASWNMPGDANVSLDAIWSTPIPGCALVPLWFRWSTPASPTSGTLNSTSGSIVDFSGDATTPGRTEVRVESAAVVTCGANSSLTVASGSGNVTVDPTLELGVLSLDPAPLAPGEAGLLRGSITGGTLPYQVRVNWTDGSFSSFGVSAPGSFAIAHSFPAGAYDPSVSVEDAGGLVATAALPGRLVVANGLDVAIDAGDPTVDVGIPATWNATLVGAGLWYTTAQECDGVRVGLSAQDALSGGCTFSSTGANSISLLVADPLLAAAVQTSARIDVVPDPAVEVASGQVPAELGVSSYLVVLVSGGVPPLELDCVGPAFVGPSLWPVYADGTVAIPIDPSEAGQIPFSIVATDADGVPSLPANGSIDASPALNASLSFDRSVNSTAATLWAVGTVSAGASPYEWVVVPGSTGTGTTATTGSLPAPGTFNWSGSYRTETSVSILALVVDAAGVVLRAARGLPTLSPLNVSDLGLAPAPSASDAELSLALAGGLPPYDLTVVASDGAEWNLTSWQNGTVDWELDFPTAGLVELSIEVRDGAGYAVELDGSVTLNGPSVVADSFGLSVVGAFAALALLGLAGVLALRWRRQRRVAPERPRVDPVAVLRGIIAPADGADRATVEMLAEEAGVPAAEAQQTLDRLVADGTVRSEIDADGSEVLAWDRDPSD